MKDIDNKVQSLTYHSNLPLISSINPYETPRSWVKKFVQIDGSKKSTDTLQSHKWKQIQILNVSAHWQNLMWY